MSSSFHYNKAQTTKKISYPELGCNNSVLLKKIQGKMFLLFFFLNPFFIKAGIQCPSIGIVFFIGREYGSDQTFNKFY